jgi:tetratricopeptide (TPR) repeat protein
VGLAGAFAALFSLGADAQQQQINEIRDRTAGEPRQLNRPYEIEYGADRAAALAACDALAYRGQPAASCYSALLASDQDPRIKAEAARSLGDRQGANAFFRTAVEQFPEDPAVRARWGNLFRETNQDNEAAKLYKESLSLDPNHVPAIVALATIAAESFTEGARNFLADALARDPENVAALLLRARMDLEEGLVVEADATLDEALEIVDARRLAPLEVYALKASAALLRGTVDSEWTKKALAFNPTYGDIYATPAYFYVITRRYREAIALYQKAVEIQPNLYAAHAELGANLLRENRIVEAQRHLVTAYNGDRASARTVNTLRLIDSFDNFVVTASGKALDPARPEPGVILRLHKDEQPVIESYVRDLVNRSIEVYTERYGYTLEEPVIAELYPDSDDFAVRTSGLPGIGLLGVTFGYLVAMDSPSARGEGEFHWGTTLWHEIAHVFTLEATDHLVPRWFSEGVSVFEEWSTGPLPGRHIPIDVLISVGEDKFLPVTELDRGFIRPTFQNQVIVSYMQAGLICEYIAANFGQEALRAMLGVYRSGGDTAEAIETATGITPTEFDERFATFVAAELDPIVANLQQWELEQRAAYEHVAAEEWSQAAENAERAITLFPDYVDENSAYVVLARAQQQAGDRAAALATLREFHKRGGYDPNALMQLARWLDEDGEPAAAIAVLEDLLLVAPLGEAVHTELGDRLLENGRAAEALAEYEILFAMKPHDQAAVHLRLAKAYRALENATLAREHLLYALEIAPNYREAQQMLLEMVR